VIPSKAWKICCHQASKRFGRRVSAQDSSGRRKDFSGASSSRGLSTDFCRKKGNGNSSERRKTPAFLLARLATSQTGSRRSRLDRASPATSPPADTNFCSPAGATGFFLASILESSAPAETKFCSPVAASLAFLSALGNFASGRNNLQQAQHLVVSNNCPRGFQQNFLPGVFRRHALLSLTTQVYFF